MLGAHKGRVEAEVDIALGALQNAFDSIQSDSPNLDMIKGDIHSALNVLVKIKRLAVETRALVDRLL